MKNRDFISDFDISNSFEAQKTVQYEDRHAKSYYEKFDLDEDEEDKDTKGLNQNIWNIIKHILNDVEFQCIYMRYYLNMTEREIVINLNKVHTQVSIHKILKRSVDKIRKHLKEG